MRFDVLKLALVVIFATLLFSPTASGARQPTPTERSALIAAVSRDEGVAIKPRVVSVSTVIPGWAVVGWGLVKPPYVFLAFHMRHRRWASIGPLLEAGEPRDALCAYAPAAAVGDLLGIHCPPWRALHAKAASLVVRKALFGALLATPGARGRGAFKLYRPCLSRLDPQWASAGVDYPDTAQPAWFHKRDGRWLVYESTHVPGAIILSLAACTGYNASEYGA